MIKVLLARIRTKEDGIGWPDLAIDNDLVLSRITLI
jgi:hypothetical protein